MENTGELKFIFIKSDDTEEFQKHQKKSISQSLKFRVICIVFLSKKQNNI